MTVSQLDASMTNEEFMKWMIFVRDRPLDTQEVQMAILTYLVNSQGGGKAKFEDFMVSKMVEKEEEPLQGKALNNYLKGMFG